MGIRICNKCNSSRTQPHDLFSVEKPISVAERAQAKNPAPVSRFAATGSSVTIPGAK